MEQIVQNKRTYDFDRIVKQHKNIQFNRLSFPKFVSLHEKMGVLSRMINDSNIFNISTIANKIIDKIQNTPDKSQVIYDMGKHQKKL